MYGPVLKGEKVTLRPPDETDAARFVEWFADQEVTRYLAVTFPLSLEQEKEFLKKIGEAKDVVWWVIEAEGKTIGGVGIHQIDWIDSRAITGIVIGDKTCWRRGYASEAMALRTAYAFRQLNLHKLSSGAFMENEASKRALMKAGYREIGVEREHLWREGRWHDHWRCEVLRADWEKHQAG
ncbi:MAG: GNAT family N-acetyltransferase [Candidatus Limnocylindria bacterium]